MNHRYLGMNHKYLGINWIDLMKINTHLKIKTKIKIRLRLKIKMNTYIWVGINPYKCLGFRSQREIKKINNWKYCNWRKRQILWVFLNKHIYELCEKWVSHDGNYVYTRFEELRTRSSEVLFTREYKRILSEEKSNTYIDIDELKIFKDFSSKDITTLKTKTKTKDMDKAIPKTKNMDKTVTKTKTEDKDMLGKINNKIRIINKTSTILAEIKVKVKMKIDAIIDDALNVTWNMICKKIE